MQSSEKLKTSTKRLAPADLAVRHRWLFTDGWPKKLPAHVQDEGYSKRGEIVETWRNKALRELYSEHGMSGIQNLQPPARHTLGISALPSKNSES